MPRPKTAAADYQRLTVRLPKDVLESLRAKAENIGRPLNTQIVRILRDGLRKCRKGKQSGEAHDQP